MSSGLLEYNYSETFGWLVFGFGVVKERRFWSVGICESLWAWLRGPGLDS